MSELWKELEENLNKWLLETFGIKGSVKEFVKEKDLRTKIADVNEKKELPKTQEKKPQLIQITKKTEYLNFDNKEFLESLDKIRKQVLNELTKDYNPEKTKRNDYY